MSYGLEVSTNLGGGGSVRISAMTIRVGPTNSLSRITDARLSEYQERPRLAADHVFGRQIDDEGWGLQVCWRIKAVDEEDFVHRFHEDLRDQGFACVDEVLKVVDWYRQRWRS